MKKSLGRLTLAFCLTLIILLSGLIPGPGRLGSFPGVPETRAADGDLKWSHYCYNPVRSAPAIAPDGTIYMTTSGILYAINPDGSEKWHCHIFSVTGSVLGHISIAPDGTIYVVGSVFLYAFKPDGTFKWQHQSSGTITVAQLIGLDGTIYFTGDDSSGNYLSAVNPDGSLKWRHQISGQHCSQTAALGADGTIYVGSDDGNLYAFKPDGSLKWNYSPIGQEGWMSYPAVGADGTIYIGFDDPYVDRGFYAINPDGSLKWKYYSYNWLGLQVSFYDPAIGPDGTIFVGCDDGRVHAINPDGSMKWISYYHYGGYSLAIGRDGTLYVSGRGTSESGAKFYALNPDGTFRWEISYGEWGAGGSFTAPAIGPDGTVYTGTGSFLLAFSSSCGGLANSAWPMFMHDPMHTGRAGPRCLNGWLDLLLGW